MERSKKILILTNNSFMFYKFRKELLEELGKYYFVELGVPIKDFTEELSRLTDKLIDLPINRRSTNDVGLTPKNESGLK